MIQLCKTEHGDYFLADSKTGMSSCLSFKIEYIITYIDHREFEYITLARGVKHTVISEFKSVEEFLQSYPEYRI